MGTSLVNKHLYLDNDNVFVEDIKNAKKYKNVDEARNFMHNSIFKNYVVNLIELHEEYYLEINFTKEVK